jgi:acyl-CoA thioesterase-1
MPARIPHACLLLCLCLDLLASSAPASGPPHKRLLCLGDSLTAGYGLDEEQAWPRLLQARLDREAPGWTVVNAGDSGDTSTDALERMDWLMKSPPSAAFVCLGANDGLRGLPVDLTARNVSKIVARLRKAGVAVFLAGMQLPTNMGPGYRDAFRALYPDLAAREKLPLMPFLLTGVAGVADLNQADGMHPNAQGERIVAGNVGDFLIPRLKRIAARGSAGGAPRVLSRRSDLGPAP